MANILVSYFFCSGEAFYDGFCEELRNHGNDVFRWNLCNYIQHTGWGESFTLNQKGKDVLAEVYDFAPDVVVGFNNACPLEIVNQTEIPVCLWDADAPNHFWHKDYIKQNVDRYHYLGFQAYSLGMYIDLFGIPQNRYAYCPAATTLRNEDLPLTQNISFIGNHFTDAIQFHSDHFKDNIEIMKFIRSELAKNYHADADQLLSKYVSAKQQLVTPSLSKQFMRVWQSVKLLNYPGIDRIQHLSNLADLGLSIYGPSSWKDMAGYYPNVAVCYNPEKIKSLEENARVYNSSKISVNISHPQATSAFSWRVMDIMASNSCVLTEYKKDWQELFGIYLSDEVRNAIVYVDKYDMRTKAVRLLENEELRKKCVKGCQDAIEKNGRWKVRLEKIGKILGIELTSSKETETRYFENILPSKDGSGNGIKKAKRMLRVSFYSLSFFIVNLPVICLLFSNRRKKYYLNKLIKWTRFYS